MNILYQTFPHSLETARRLFPSFSESASSLSSFSSEQHAGAGSSQHNIPIDEYTILPGPGSSSSSLKSHSGPQRRRSVFNSFNFGSSPTNNNNGTYLGPQEEADFEIENPLVVAAEKQSGKVPSNRHVILRRRRKAFTFGSEASEEEDFEGSRSNLWDLDQRVYSGDYRKILSRTRAKSGHGSKDPHHRELRRQDSYEELDIGLDRGSDFIEITEISQLIESGDDDDESDSDDDEDTLPEHYTSESFWKVTHTIQTRISGDDQKKENDVQVIVETKTKELTKSPSKALGGSENFPTTFETTVRVSSSPSRSRREKKKVMLPRMSNICLPPGTTPFKLLQDEWVERCKPHPQDECISPNSSLERRASSICLPPGTMPYKELHEDWAERCKTKAEISKPPPIPETTENMVFGRSRTSFYMNGS